MLLIQCSNGVTNSLGQEQSRLSIYLFLLNIKKRQVATAQLMQKYIR